MEIQMKNAYKEALAAYEKEDYLTAADKFNEAEMLFPQSEWAPKSSLNAAYSYYVDEYYNVSIRKIHKNIPR